MHKNYKIDEQIITNIIHRYIKPIEHQKQIKLIIYCTKFMHPRIYWIEIVELKKGIDI